MPSSAPPIPGPPTSSTCPTPDGPLHERLAALVAERAGRLAGECGLSGMGAVVGATEPEHLGRLRELMPTSVFLIPGVGAQGGNAEGPRAGPGRASGLDPRAASRSIAGADDPGRRGRSLAGGAVEPDRRLRARTIVAPRPRQRAGGANGKQHDERSRAGGHRSLDRPHPGGPGRGGAAIALFLVISGSMESGGEKGSGRQGRDGAEAGAGAAGRVEGDRITWSSPATRSAGSRLKVGVPVERIEELNPEIDPQALPSGRHAASCVSPTRAASRGRGAGRSRVRSWHGELREAQRGAAPGADVLGAVDAEDGDVLTLARGPRRAADGEHDQADDRRARPPRPRPRRRGDSGAVLARARWSR